MFANCRVMNVVHRCQFHRIYSKLKAPRQRYYSSSNVNIFDRVAKKIQKDRAFECADANLYDYIRIEIADQMVDRMYDLTKECKTIAEIGCNRGFITRHELPEGIEQFYLCDSSEIALKQAEQAAKPDGYKLICRQMDEEVPKVGPFLFQFEFVYRYRFEMLFSLSLTKIHWIWLYQI